MASITISGTLTIDIQGLEENLKKLEDLKIKIDGKIQELITKAKKVASADNWPNLQDNSERLVKVYEDTRAQIEEKIVKVKAEITKVIESIQERQTEIKNKFGQLLIDYGNKIMNEAEETAANPGAKREAAQQKAQEFVDNTKKAIEEAPAKAKEAIEQAPTTIKNAAEQAKTKVQESVNNTKSILRQKIDSLGELFKGNTTALKERITNLNSTGSIKNLFDNASSSISNLFKRK